MAYRSGRAQPRVKPQGGLIEEVVQQFADRYAYARELVQNGIDAGATRIDVELTESDERLHVRFSDDGCGMTLDVIRGPLLTLFSSSKEGQEGKIGRYGVGFKSVLAVDPEVVHVQTHRAEGAYAVRLYRDYTFEIEPRPAAPGSGTSVELVVADTEIARREHAAKLRSALSRWCRHVRCPIQLREQGGGWVSINEPLSIRAPVVVGVEDDGVRVVVGPTAGTRWSGGAVGPEGEGDFAGFYGRGLTLLEAAAREPCLPGLRFKVDGPGLSCTISRDDVRRDGAFERAMKLVRRTSEGALDAALDDALARAAAAYAAQGDDSTLEAYRPLLAASIARRPKKATRVALVEPLEGEAVLSLHRIEALRSSARVVTATRTTPLTRRAVEAGYACVRLDPGGTVAEIVEPAGPPVDEAFSLLAAVGAAPSHPALVALRAVLARAGRAVTSIVPVVVGAGKWTRLAAFVGGEGGRTRGTWVDPFDVVPRGERLLLGPQLWERLERAAAVERAAALVARIVLIEQDGATSAKLNDRLLSASAGGSRAGPR